MSKNPKAIFNFQFSIFNLRAQSLIEVVIAMAVIVGLAVALVTTTLVVQKASRTAKNNTQATKLVQQNIEQVRVYRDRKGFDALDNNACALDTSDSNPANWNLVTVSCPADEVVILNNTDFKRKISICYADNNNNCTGTITNKKLVTVIVSWTDSSGTQSVSNQTILSSGQ